MIGAVLILSFLFLMAVFRSVVLPLKAVVMNLLSVGAAYGVMVAVFQWGWLGSVIGIGQTGPIDPWIPSRCSPSSSGSPWTTRSSCCRGSGKIGCSTGDNSLAVADGLAVTGRVITAAAAIMFCVFASFVIKDPLHILKVFGLGLAVAVAVDVTLVRMVLVPSLMELLGPRNWWMPRFLQRTIPTIGAEVTPPPVPVAGLTWESPRTSLDSVRNESETFVSINPGRDVQRVGTAAFLGEDVGKIHDPVWAVIGNLGDSQCYLGVPEKVQALQAALSRRIAEDDLAVRLIPPAFTLGVSDGQLNGTPQMRFSLVGRELVHDVADVHLAANSVAGLVAVVACDKPPVGTVAAVLENNTPAVIVSDGPIRPGIDPETGGADRPRLGLPGGRPGRRGPGPVRPARLSRAGQLRGHVHLQHDADLHRGARARAAAHGGPAVGRPAPADRVPRSDGRLPARHDEGGHPPARHRHARLAAQRPDGHHRHGRVHQRAAAQRRDRPRRRPRPLGATCSARTSSTSSPGDCRCW